MKYRETFETPAQVLTEAILLGLTAPDDEGLRAVTLLLADLYKTFGYDESTIEMCKASALERWELEAF